MVEARSLRKALNARFPASKDCTCSLRRRPPSNGRTTVAWSASAMDRTYAANWSSRPRGATRRCGEQAGIPVTRIPYHQTAIVCAVAHEHPHHDLALEHFLPAGPFAALPMGPSADAEPGGASNVSAIVWTERTRDAATFMALDDVRFAREAGRRLGSHLGAVRAIGRRWSYPLSAMIAHRYVDTRLALAGDAAHGIHPIAGQGLNLGFRDGIALADLIIEACRAGRDVGGKAVLARYQRVRQADNLLMFAMTDGIDRLFSSDHRLVRVMRDLGISTVNGLGPMKRLFMRRAMGIGATLDP